MLSQLKRNHRYTFYKKRHESDEIKTFRATVISATNNTLLFHSYESDEYERYKFSNHCVWSMPTKWIIRVEVLEEDEVIDHSDIFVSSTEELIVLD